ncbi:hypothetical protein AX17_003727 [Amanita inopinata Kibby_2008]|nr:hypothetical protein AX17_003727 [Amanita inopinata Kibby_2008]
MTSTHAANNPLSIAEAFMLGGIAACCAVTFSNPAEVAKTRLQLQGELTKRGGVRVYKNTFDVLVKTLRNEGIRGVQRGLAPAYVYQVLANGARLGFYEPIRRSLNRLVRLNPSEHNPATSLMAGASTGVVGCVMANPMFLIKARMQAYSPSLPVGTQRYYKSSFDALRSIVRVEGIVGLTRGMSTAMIRTAFGSSVQVPTYIWAKSALTRHGILPANSFWTFFVSSSISGICVLTVIQPADTVLTRMYNQPTRMLSNGKHAGLLYKNPIDALVKIFRTEGFRGWYKGSTAHLLRIAPHTVIVLTVNDLITKFYTSYRQPCDV